MPLLSTHVGSTESGGFDPTAAPKLVVWLDANQITGLNDGDSVTTWSDGSGNSNNAAQSTAALKPLYKTNIVNGKPVVRFDGSNDYMTIADSSSYKVASLSIFLVCKTTNATDPGEWIVGYPHNTTHADPYARWMLFWFTSGADTSLNQRLNGTSTSSAAITGWTSFHVYEQYAADGDSLKDGTVVINAAGASITYPNAVGIYVGANADGGENFTGDIAEILVYATDLPTAKRNAVRAYLNSKYGL